MCGPARAARLHGMAATGACVPSAWQACKVTQAHVQVWRYYLLSNRPETSDADFKWADFVAKNNAELLGNLGNFVHRTLSFAYARQGCSQLSCMSAMPAGN